MKKMRMATFVFCFWSLLPVCAQKQQKLEGLWQKCTAIDVNGKIQISTQPYLKLLLSDGSFQNLFMRMSGNGSFILTYGTYRQTSDTTYVEHIHNSISDPLLIKKENVLKFQIQKGGWLLIMYRMPGAVNEAHEIWKRIEIHSEKKLFNTFLHAAPKVDDSASLVSK
ncbi:MAG: DUF4488 domain-containing protein [Bacteroidaceae bacterium]